VTERRHLCLPSSTMNCIGPLGSTDPSSSLIARSTPSRQSSPGSSFSESGNPRLLTAPFGRTWNSSSSNCSTTTDSLGQLKRNTQTLDVILFALSTSLTAPSLTSKLGLPRELHVRVAILCVQYHLWQAQNAQKCPHRARGDIVTGRREGGGGMLCDSFVWSLFNFPSLLKRKSSRRYLSQQPLLLANIGPAFEVVKREFCYFTALVLLKCKLAGS